MEANNKISEKNRKWKHTLELATQIATLFGGVAAIFTAVFAWWAYREYNATNYLSARTVLFSTSEAIASREHEALYSNFYVEIPNSVPDKDYYRTVLKLFVKDEEIIASKDAEALYLNIWGLKSWDSKDRAEIQNLRRIYLHAESYLYHIQNAFDYHKAGILQENEWKTWEASIDDLGDHPVFLAALWSAHRRGYLSKSYASEIQRRILVPENKRIGQHVKIFYKELLEVNWVEKFPEY